MSASSAILATKVIHSSAKEISKAQKELLDYDFIGLVTKLVVFFTLAYIIVKWVEAVTFLSGGIAWLAKFAGLNIPTNAPKQLVDFVNTGWKGIKFWDIIKIIAVFIVVYEMMEYKKRAEANNQKVNVMTIAIFGLLASFLSIITFPEIYQRLKENKLLVNNP